MCFGRRKITHAVVEAAVATMVPRTQAILRALLRRCLSGSRAAIIYAAASRLDLLAAAHGAPQVSLLLSAQVLREQPYLDQGGCGDGVMMLLSINADDGGA